MKVTVFEIPPDGNGLNTVTAAVPPETMSCAEIMAVSCVGFKKAVARLTPFHCTIDVGMKLSPLTVREKAGPPAKISEGAIKVTIGGIGAPCGPLDVNTPVSRQESGCAPIGAAADTKARKRRNLQCFMPLPSTRDTEYGRQPSHIGTEHGQELRSSPGAEPQKEPLRLIIDLECATIQHPQIHFGLQTMVVAFLSRRNVSEGSGAANEAQKRRANVGAGCQTAPRPVGVFDPGPRRAAGTHVFSEQRRADHPVDEVGLHEFPLPLVNSLPSPARWISIMESRRKIKCKE